MWEAAKEVTTRSSSSMQGISSAENPPLLEATILRDMGSKKTELCAVVYQFI